MIYLSPEFVCFVQKQMTSSKTNEAYYVICIYLHNTIIFYLTLIYIWTQKILYSKFLFHVKYCKN